MGSYLRCVGHWLGGSAGHMDERACTGLSHYTPRCLDSTLTVHCRSDKTARDGALRRVGETASGSPIWKPVLHRPQALRHIRSITCSAIDLVLAILHDGLQISEPAVLYRLDGFLVF